MRKRRGKVIWQKECKCREKCVEDEREDGGEAKGRGKEDRKKWEDRARGGRGREEREMGRGGKTGKVEEGTQEVGRETQDRSEGRDRRGTRGEKQVKGKIVSREKRT